MYFIKMIEPMILMILVAASAITAVSAEPASEAKNLPTIPYIDGIQINADLEDWGDNGFRVEIMNALKINKWNKSASDFMPAIKLGWNNNGLLVLVTVKDSYVMGSDDLEYLYLKDCVELWAGENSNGSNSYQTAISPGTDMRNFKPKTFFWDRRTDAASRPPLKIESAIKLTSDGYIAEVLLPWENLGIKPKIGARVGFQAVIDDYDRNAKSYDDGMHAFWCPIPGSSPSEIGNMYSVILGKKASPPVLASGTGEYIYSKDYYSTIHASAELTDKTIALKSGRKLLDKATAIKGADGWGEVKFKIPAPADGEPYKDLTIFDGKTEIGKISMFGNPILARVNALESANLHPLPYVFNGPEFPSCDFQQNLLAERIIGPYEIKTTFYDSEFNEVKTAEKPGRYGAVVEVTPLNGGNKIKRFKTLFRKPVPFEWWDVNLDINVKLPEQLGIDPETVKNQPNPVSEMFKWSLVSDVEKGGMSAVVLAGLYETDPKEPKAARYNDCFAKDRQWWVGLKRKLYGQDKLYPNEFVCPRPKEGTPATIVHTGTLEEAGMMPDAYDKIDTYLKQWEADTDEGFATCIVRHGVIVLHKAYGTRDGKPMTVDSPSWMASNTKTMAANIMWMLIDQGLVGLDDPVEKYIPALKGIKNADKVTIRHLYNHTWGFYNGDHWGDDTNDLEEVMREYFPGLEVGSRQMYNGVGYAIGGKITESIIGDSMPVLYKKYFADPLGLTRTEVTNTSYDAQSIPLDMAKISQMMLNKGTYGNKRFYSAETFEKMLPENMNGKWIPNGAATTTPDTWWGVGLMNYSGEGLGQGTYGHGSAAGATLRIDPVNDLIIVMTRNSVGKNYDKYHQKFIETVASVIDKSK